LIYFGKKTPRKTPDQKQENWPGKLLLESCYLREAVGGMPVVPAKCYFKENVSVV